MNGGSICDATCHIPACGDGIIEAGEACDPPNKSTCDDNCQSIPIVCGNGIVQPGESCDFNSPRACVNCSMTRCAQCWAFLQGGDGCDGLNLQDTIACNQLVGCALNSSICGLSGGPIGKVACYCGPSFDCSAGALGPCAAQFNTVAHSTDPAVVLQQILNGNTPVGRVAAAVAKFGGPPCGLECSTN